MREWLDDRHYRILHNRYDERGNVVEQFYRYYTENETDDAVYLTKEFITTFAKQMSGKSTSKSNYINSEKPHYYEVEVCGEAVQIDGIVWSCDGKTTTVTVDCTNGDEIVFFVPVE